MKRHELLSYIVFLLAIIIAATCFVGCKALKTADKAILEPIVKGEWNLEYPFVYPGEKISFQSVKFHPFKIEVSGMYYDRQGPIRFKAEHNLTEEIALKKQPIKTLLFSTLGGEWEVAFPDSRKEKAIHIAVKDVKASLKNFRITGEFQDPFRGEVDLRFTVHRNLLNDMAIIIIRLIVAGIL